MKSLIRKLEVSEIPAFVEIAVNAYPGVMQNTPDFKERFSTMITILQEKEKTIEFFGLFRDGKLVGGMRIHYFQMNLFSKIIDVGGVGLVAVDLLHKKEKIAKELISYFIQHFVNREVSFLALYPFRPDFYKKMGFGYGTKMNQYLIEPSSFPARGTKEGLTFLNKTHKEHIKDCYNLYAKETHGMMLKTDYDVEVLFKNPDHKIVGCFNGEKLEGYIVFTFKKMSETNFIHNNIVIKEMIYRNPQALSKIAAFLNSQNDQIHRIELTTQDDAIEYLIADPRNGSNRLMPSVYHETNSAGIGLMYRIINMDAFIEKLSEYNFNNVTIKLGINIMDSFIEGNSRRIVIDFREGKAAISQAENADVEIKMEISDLSSLFMGVINFKKLYDFGRAEINIAEIVNEVNTLFSTMQKPLCITAF
ncbi:enhanced intracellular survival protein Eis [Bacillus sp. S/N-304-OC-R1]|uniref:GNAT family N-acetyltransferase n=1 Tax=Bacillus sp. S/N-304-OC-R1 TaxID=2758034 RepID=UPI001C8EE733|nr:GNAT family N-acetyltransferase [Bacillus sp. S/N-304-OC-R1]MBY0122806.1 GNAT family N-acetyltransferase [Bacillus sp. S/N-304-OC-R1]